jgi:hypothetical protein
MTKIKRACGYGGKCPTLTTVDNAFDLESMGMFQTNWCDFHWKLFRKTHEILKSHLSEYQRKNIKNIRGQKIEFKNSTDLSNYLYRNNKRKLNQIEKRATKLIS